MISSRLRRRLNLPLSALLLGLSLTVPAAAQPPPDDAAKSAQVKVFYMDGVKFAATGQWQKAFALFAKAFRLKQHFQIALNLGQAELKVGRHRDAAEHLSYFLREAQGIPDEELRQGKEMLAEAQKHVGTLHVRVEPAGAEVTVDGTLAGKSPVDATLFVEPGRRTVEAKLDGYKPATDAREIEAGTEVTVELRLEKVPENMVSSSPLPPHPVGGLNKAFVVGGLAVAGVGIGLGAGFAAAAVVKNGDLFAERDRLVAITLKGEKICTGLTDPRCSTLVQLGATRDTFRNVAVAGFAVGVLAAAGTVAIVVLKPRWALQGEQERSSLILVPSLQGAFAVGTF